MKLTKKINSFEEFKYFLQRNYIYSNAYINDSNSRSDFDWISQLHSISEMFECFECLFLTIILWFFYIDDDKEQKIRDI